MPIGITVTTSETAQPIGLGTSTGTLFVAGLADQGPLTATKCLSINDYVTTYGARSSTSAALYDTVDVFFREGGQQTQVARVSDGTAVAASQTLSDAVPHPSVVVTAKTAGTAGNGLYVVVNQTANTTFTGTTTNTSTSVTAVSSFTNIAAGTLVTGTGIPANTYVVSVNTGASTLVLSQAATASNSGTVITPYTFTVLIQDVAGDVLETHGPFINTAALYLDTTSTLVTFAQSAGGGFTVNNPAVQTTTALSSGANASDLTDASYISTLNTAFTPGLGPGQVAIPGKNSSTIISGLGLHCQANNRVGLLDLGNTGTAASYVSTLGTATAATFYASYVVPIAGNVTVPGTTPGTTRTVSATAPVAGLLAQVAATNNDNQAPAGRSWPLQYVTGLTQTFNAADTNTLNASGINTFATRYNVLCLFGFTTTVPQTSDLIYWSAAAARERMALVDQAAQIAEPYLFRTIDGRQVILTAFQSDLQALLARHWKAGALFGFNATDAGVVVVSSPVNTAATEAAGQLNADLTVRISEFAQQITLNISATALTQTIAT